jgi:Domain of unknown function (DUF4166)
METSSDIRELYPRLLNDCWAKLPDAVRGLHYAGSAVRGVGLLRVTWGPNRLARLIAAILRLPTPGEAVPVTLTITRSADLEVWRRTFADIPLLTRQWSGPGGVLVEQAGLVEMRFRLEVLDGGLIFHHAETALRLGWLRIPLPRWLAPRVTAREAPAQQKDEAAISVRVSVPVLGLLISYEGLMTRSAEEA